MAAIRWVSWAAVSSLPQAKKISNEAQLELSRKHAARHGATIVAELVVPGESRSIVLFEDAARRIEAYAQLKHLLDARAMDVLAYLDSSRLGRIDALIMSVRALCRQAGVILYELDSPPATLTDARHDDNLLGAIKAVGAEQEIHKLVERRASGILGRARNGYAPGNLPYGYRVEWAIDDTGRRVAVYHVEPGEAAAVRQIFAWYLDGAGTPAIAQRLQAAGVVSASGATQWTKNMVKSIMRMLWRYAGYVEVNRRSERPYYRGRGNWTAIIDDATAQAVASEIQARAANRKLADARHVLSGICYCATCGHAMIINRYSNGSAFLRCERHKPATRVKATETLAVLHELIADLSARGIDDYLAADDADPTAQIDTQRQTQQAALANLAKSKARADGAYVDGNLSADDYAAQVARLRSAEAAIRAELTRLDDAAAQAKHRQGQRGRIEEFIAQAHARLDDDDSAAANAWLRRYVRVWCANREIVSIEWL